MSMKQHIHHIIVKHLSAEATHEEEQALKLWLAESDENRQIYDEHIQLWNNLDNAFDQTKFDADRAWKAMEDRIQPKPSQNRILFPNYLKYLSAAAVVLISLFIWAPWEPKEQVILAQNDAEQIWLPDSTLVTLRNGSSLTYNADYNKLDLRSH
jgi:transmembrane sensor